MDWTQALTVIGVFIGGFFFLMNRMDANKKDLEHKIDANQKENNTRFNSLENRQTAMEVEIKNINQRLSNIENCVMPRKVYCFEEHHRDEEEPKEN
jgi:hypothetical protein